VTALGKMVAFEGLAALALFAFGKLAPKAKQRATDAAKASIAEASPELAQQIDQAEDLERQGLAQFSSSF